MVFRQKNAPPFNQVQAFRLEALRGPRIDSLSMNKPTVLVFWATWCGPCKVELARIQRLVSNSSIAPDSVVAVDVGEEKDNRLAGSFGARLYFQCRLRFFARVLQISTRSASLQRFCLEMPTEQSSGVRRVSARRSNSGC